MLTGCCVDSEAKLMLFPYVCVIFRIVLLCMFVIPHASSQPRPRGRVYTVIFFPVSCNC